MGGPTGVIRLMRRHSAAFIALLIALAVLSLFNDSGTSKVRAITGDVVEWQGGQWISVANEQTDPGGVRINLRAADYDGDRDAIRAGARVTVWYRTVEERYPVAVRMQVLR